MQDKLEAERQSVIPELLHFSHHVQLLRTVVCGGACSRDNILTRFKRRPSHTSDGKGCLCLTVCMSHSYPSLCLHLFSLSEILALVSLSVLEKAEEQAVPEKQEKHVSCLHACLSVI